MMKQCIFILLCFSSLNLVSGQSLSPKTKRLVYKIAKYNVLTSQGVGEAGTETNQWKRYLQLKKLSTDTELISLTNHKNAVVRGYAFMALSARNYPKLVQILISHLKDTTRFLIFHGCLIHDIMVGDFFIYQLAPYRSNLNSFKLTKHESNVIDSIIIFDKDIILDCKTELLYKLNKEEKYYHRVREMVIEDNNYVALIALSKYQKQEDKELIIQGLMSDNSDFIITSLQCVINFPDSTFFVYLKNLHSIEMMKKDNIDVHQLKSLYNAIVQYKNKHTIELIDLTLNTLTGYALRKHNECLLTAFDNYPDVYYNEIIEKIKRIHD